LELKSYNLKYKRFGESSVLVEWPSKINESILENILLFKSEIEKKYLNKNIYLKNSYNSLLITYREIINSKAKISELNNIYIKIGSKQKQVFNKWEIPVCYDIDPGHDLAYLEKSLSIKKEEIISLHNSKDYRVYNIGFLPGFLYLGGLDKKIHHPRKEKPILNVPKGAIGIGGSQTGIYPNNSPGGWYIIGNSPINLFNINKTSPCFIKPGDKIKFNPISLKEHELIKIQVESNIYKPIKTRIND
jgi:inhibitor of KinA